MKTYMRIFSLIVLLSVIPSYSICAQTLSATEKAALQRRVKDKVDEFQFYLGQLADKRSTSPTVKDNAFRLALKLFIGECEPYTIYDPDLGHQINKSAVRMETSSKHRNTKSRTRIKAYLNNLRNNQSYSQIKITDADIVRVDNIYKVGDHYECMAYFCQKYIGYRDGRIVYSDITTKKVRVYINAIQVPKADGSTETIWNALLGDIYVVETR